MNISSIFIFIFICLFSLASIEALEKKNVALKKDGVATKGTNKGAKFAFLQTKSKLKLSSGNSLNSKKSGAKKKKGSLCCTAVKKVAKVVLKQGKKVLKCAVGKQLPFGMGKGLTANNCRAKKAGKGGKESSSPSPAPTESTPGKPNNPPSSSAGGQAPPPVFQLPPDSPCNLGRNPKYSFLQTGSRSKDICCTAIKKVTKVVAQKATPILKCTVGKLLPLGLGRGMVENNCKAGKGSSSDSASGLRNPSSTNNAPAGPGGGQQSFADARLSQGLACGRGVGRGRFANNFSPDDFAGDWWDSQG